MKLFPLYIIMAFINFPSFQPTCEHTSNFKYYIIYRHWFIINEIWFLLKLIFTNWYISFIDYIFYKRNKFFFKSQLCIFNLIVTSTILLSFSMYRQWIQKFSYFSYKFSYWSILTSNRITRFTRVIIFKDYILSLFNNIPYYWN